MNVTEAISRQVDMQERIQSEVRKFETDTGLEVMAIHINRTVYRDANDRIVDSVLSIAVDSRLKVR
jgi:hypothetical protein